MVPAGWLVALAAARAGTIEDADPYWQIRAGLENLAGMPLVRSDSWSWAPTGGDFYPNSPAWNVVLALGWQAAGFWGLFALTLVSVTAFGVIVAVAARAMGARPMAVLAGALPVAVLALPMLSARATLPAQALFLGAVVAGWSWTNGATRRPGWVNALGLLVLGFVVAAFGSWIHLSWVAFAGLTAVAWSVMCLLVRALPLRQRVGSSVAGVVGLGLGVTAGPYDIATMLERSRVVARANTGLVVEWMSPFTQALTLRWGLPAILALVVVAASIRFVIRYLRRGEAPDPALRLRAGLTLAGAGTALAALTAVRFTGVALLTVAPLVPLLVPPLAHRLRRLASRAPMPVRGRALEWTTERFWRPVAVAVVLVVTPMVAVAAWPHATPAGTAAIAQIPSGCTVFASYEQSAAIILLRPDLTVWVDGRSDYYGRQRLRDAIAYFSTSSPPGGRTAPAGAGCALFPSEALDPEYAPVTRRLDADPAWERVATTPQATLWINRGERR